jgi:hypothetical protein
VPAERGVVPQVAPEEVTWILEEAMQPLQAGVFDPVWDVFDVSSMAVECRAYAEHQAGLNSRQEPHHESLLLGSTDANPKNMGFQRDELPVPAAFLVSKAGEVIRSYVEVDYMKRLAPETALKWIDEIS